MWKLALKEKIGYALGDGAANIAWRGVSHFPVDFLYRRLWVKSCSCWITYAYSEIQRWDNYIAMGILCDRTNSKYGKFRPWILWTAIPLGVTLSLLFTSPKFGPTGRIIYAYATYRIFSLFTLQITSPMAPDGRYDRRR